MKQPFFLSALLLSAVQAVAQPTITRQPTDLAVNAGNDAYLNVYATSSVAPILVQWRFNGQPLGGETSWTLELEEVGTDDLAGDYDAVISDPFNSVTSAVARVTVVPAPPRFTTISAGGTVYLGGPMTLVTYAKGTQPIAYQWFKDGAPLAGATSTEYRTTNVVAADAGAYFVVASNTVGTTTSQVAQITVKALDTSGPNDRSVLWGAGADFSTSVYSTVPVTIRWFHNDALVPGATNSRLVLYSAQPADAGQYFIIASNQFTTVTSRVATLTVVTMAPSVGNYNPQGSVGSVNITDGVRVPIGGTVTFNGYASGGPPPTLQWQHNGVDLPGQTNSFLRLANLTTNDAGLFILVATNFLGSATSEPRRLEVVPLAPFFTMMPSNRTAVAGSAVTLHGYAVGGPPPTLQWRRGGADLPGQTNFTLLLPNVSVDDSGAYELVARNGVGQTSVSNLLNVRRATGLDQWRWRNPLPQGNRLKSAAWGQGRWVAVGNAGSVLTSTDSTNWTAVVLDACADFETVAFGNGVFVLAGQTRVSSITLASPSGVIDAAGVVFISTDGLTWTPGHCPDFESMQEIAFGGGLFVAACGGWWNGAFAYTSLDGAHWTPQFSDANAKAGRVAWGNALFLAAGSGVLHHSADAVHWTRVISPSFTGIFGLAHGNGRYVAIGDNGAVLVSTDGDAWTLATNSTRILCDVAGGPGGFVAATTSNGRLLTSPDGLSWTEMNTGQDVQFEAVAYGGGQYVMVGEGGTVITSPDGAAWSPNLVGNQIDMYGLAQSGPLLVAVGEKGTILTSTDGRDWTPRASTTTRNLHAVHFADGLFVATGRSGTILTSSDGLTWTQRSSGSVNYLERVTWANGLWVAVGEGGDICTSSNGLAWTKVNTGVPAVGQSPTDHEGIAYGNGVWVAAGGYFLNGSGNAHSSIYRSTNGAHWVLVAANLDIGVRLRDVAFGAGRFLAAGNDGWMATSIDGVAWTTLDQLGPEAQAGFSNFRRVHFANGHFVLAGNDGMLCSAPASTNDLSSWPSSPLFLDLSWTENRSRTTQNLHDIFAAADGTFYALGNNGMILQSGQTRPHLAAFRFANGGLELRHDPGLVPTADLRLEASTDLLSWQSVATDLTAPITIPTTNHVGHFFRLVAP